MLLLAALTVLLLGITAVTTAVTHTRGRRT
ncbi:hypothetical protein SMD44_00987 [Streptomyces alboflavus]|uniref:Uncharacterized protein n=1 Tax=Streptomyces alboflavus TaxID=67267 RepID=A0A1Z1W5D9_9ACTN|nr:hypothetical protein SMD44_00987 [Streptomyces alboflavus]